MTHVCPPELKRRQLLSCSLPLEKSTLDCLALLSLWLILSLPQALHPLPFCLSQAGISLIKFIQLFLSFSHMCDWCAWIYLLCFWSLPWWGPVAVVCWKLPDIFPKLDLVTSWTSTYVSTHPCLFGFQMLLFYWVSCEIDHQLAVSFFMARKGLCNHAC